MSLIADYDRCTLPASRRIGSYLEQRGPCGAADLALALELRKNTVTEALQALRKAGLVREDQNARPVPLYASCSRDTNPPLTSVELARRVTEAAELARHALTGLYEPYMCQRAAIACCCVASRVYQVEGGTRRKQALDDLEHALWRLAEKDEAETRTEIAELLLLASAARREGER